MSDTTGTEMPELIIDQGAVTIHSCRGPCKNN